jgi:hypothetical protein
VSIAVPITETETNRPRHAHVRMMVMILARRGLEKTPGFALPVVHGASRADPRENT